MDGRPRFVQRAATAACLAVVVASCAAGPDPGQLRAQAKAALDRYAEAVAKVAGTGFQPAGELTGQVGDWEASVGSNNKLALMAGQVEAVDQLSWAFPPPGTVTWSDGTSATFPLLSAAAALDLVRSTATGGCLGCDSTPAPLRVTGATLTTVSIGTSRGPAVVPAWSFSLEGSAVRITRIAVAPTVVVVAPTWDPNHPAVGMWIDGAALAADGVTLTVSFVGAPRPASQGCGADYTAEGVESDLAVVAIVYTHANPIPGSCTAEGMTRTATLTLASALGSRAVLQVLDGTPVPVTGS